MRLRHYEHFSPRCAACVWRARAGDPSRAATFDCAGLPRLVLERIEAREGDGPGGGDLIVHGVLRCEDGACGERYPIIDGVAMITVNVRELIKRDGETGGGVTMRGDVPPGVEAFVAEAMGPNGAFDRERLYAGAYAWDHYGSGGLGEGGDAVQVLRRLREMGGNRPLVSGGFGRVLDVGCATGGVSLELGAMIAEDGGDGLVLGVDMHIGMLRVAQRTLRSGYAEYSLRHEGVVYRRVRAAVDARRMSRASSVDFWCCDALVMPFASASAEACVALHTLDAVASPAGLLSELARVTRPGAAGGGGRVLLASPFDWTANVTAMEHWLGGHASHAEHGGDGARVMEWLLSEGAPRGSGIDRLRVIGRDEMEWRVRLYERAMTHYRTHMIACEVGSA